MPTMDEAMKSKTPCKGPCPSTTRKQLLGGRFHKTTTEKPKGLLGHLFHQKDDTKEKKKGPFHFGSDRTLEKPMKMSEHEVDDVMNEYFEKHQQVMAKIQAKPEERVLLGDHQEVMDHMQGKWEADSVGSALRGISGTATAFFVGAAVAMAAGVMIVGRRFMYGQGGVRGVHRALLRSELEDGTQAEPIAE